MAESELFERGLQRRREVLGDDYVDASLRDSDEFMMVVQRAVTEVAWGWARVQRLLAPLDPRGRDRTRLRIHRRWRYMDRHLGASA